MKTGKCWVLIERSEYNKLKRMSKTIMTLQIIVLFTLLYQITFG